jgi:transformation/transcription domain-associated protein
LATDYKTGFITQIDTLLEESVLIGHGRMAYETLRPLAYTTLFDLINLARSQLALSQLAKVVRLYTANLHDTTLPFGIHTMSAKLLWHLVESIIRAKDLTEGTTVLDTELRRMCSEFVVTSILYQSTTIDARTHTHTHCHECNHKSLD